MTPWKPEQNHAVFNRGKLECYQVSGGVCVVGSGCFLPTIHD